MADVNSSAAAIEALIELDELILEASLWASVSSGLVGDGPDVPSWPYLVQLQVRRIEAAAAVVQSTVRDALGRLP